MRKGKLTSKELETLVLGKIKSKRSEVLMSSALSEDCAAVKCDDIILLTTDPITAAENNVGALTLDVSANDIAASGGEPFCCLLTLIAPPDASSDEIGRVVDDAVTRANELGIDIVGGHTEFSDAVTRIITSCTMLGRTKHAVKTCAAKVGDSIIMTKTAGLEGTFVLAGDFADKLNLSEAEMAEIAGYKQLISVVKDGEAAAEFAHSMHDITEGGVFGAISEMTEVSGVGAELFVKDVPVTDLTLKICAFFDINPLGLLSSGSMLITTDKPRQMLDNLNNVGISAHIIGKITKNLGAYAVYADGSRELLEVAADELYKAGKL